MCNNKTVTTNTGTRPTLCSINNQPALYGIWPYNYIVSLSQSGCMAAIYHREKRYSVIDVAWLLLRNCPSFFRPYFSSTVNHVFLYVEK